MTINYGFLSNINLDEILWNIGYGCISVHPNISSSDNCSIENEIGNKWVNGVGRCLWNFLWSVRMIRLTLLRWPSWFRFLYRSKNKRAGDLNRSIISTGQTVCIGDKFNKEIWLLFGITTCFFSRHRGHICSQLRGFLLAEKIFRKLSIIPTSYLNTNVWFMMNRVRNGWIL